jgi:broad specificity phosphatase PhoE
MSEKFEPEHYFATRHARPAREAKEGDPVSKEYPDLTEYGVEQARERARNEIFDLVRNAPEKAVVFIGGTSDQPRTKQTAEIYGDTLSALKEELEQEKVTVVTKSDIDRMVAENVGEEAVKTAAKEKAFMPGQIIKVVRKLQELVANTQGKVIIDYPLMLKELAYKYKNRWTDQKGAKTKYFAEVLKKHGQNHYSAGEDWIENQGRLEVGGKVIQGPNPQEVAEDYLHGLKRLRNFVEKNAPGRPVVVGEVGHQWDLDALVTYLANEGKVDFEGYKKVSQEQGIMKEAEITEVIVEPEKSIVRYRGNEFIQNVETDNR